MSIKNKRDTRTLFSRHGLHPRLQAIKLLASLTYPLKITKGRPNTGPIMSHDLLLVNIRHGIGLSGVCRCGWCLKLKHLERQLKGGDRHCPLLKLVVLLLHSILKVDDRVSASVHLLMSGV
jgi:hypothetical protein